MLTHSTHIFCLAEDGESNPRKLAKVPFMSFSTVRLDGGKGSKGKFCMYGLLQILDLFFTIPLYATLPMTHSMFG